jgi:transposase
VVDHFHLAHLANDAVIKVLRRVAWDLCDRRGRRIDPEWANRRGLLLARECLSDKSFAKMIGGGVGRGRGASQRLA